MLLDNVLYIALIIVAIIYELSKRGTGNKESLEELLPASNRSIEESLEELIDISITNNELILRIKDVYIDDNLE